MTDKRSFDPDELEPVDRYKLMTGLIVPRPIGWVGSRHSDGSDNLAPFSFFNMVSGSPPTVLFTTGMIERTKDTLDNIRSHPYFTLNTVTEEVAAAMNVTSGSYAEDVDEFVEAGLTKVEGSAVPAPMVMEAKANFECVVSHVHEVGEGPSASVVFGEVVAIHVAEQLLDGTRIDLAALRAVGRLTGPWYSKTTDLFEMPRPD